MILGINSHNLEQEDIDELLALGCKHVRTTLYPALWENDPIYRTNFSQGLARAKQHGIEILVTVHSYLPEWDVNKCINWTVARAEEYEQTIDIWQIGNEDWSSPGNWDIEKYNELLIEIHLTLRYKLRHRATVLSKALLNSLTAKHCRFPDAFAVHTYGGLVQKSSEQRFWFLRSDPVWITEVGEDVNLSSEERQAFEIKEFLITAPQLNYQRAYIFCLYSKDEGHGILREDRSRRPAWDVIHSYLNS